jgi:hypothetical protein
MIVDGENRGEAVSDRGRKIPIDEELQAASR